MSHNSYHKKHNYNSAGNTFQPKILADHKYRFKTYNITTSDGYILTVYRITRSPKQRGNKSKGKNKQAVYLNHGLGLASDCWNFQPNSRNLRKKN